MATAAQITAETYWQREIVTPELTWLGDELCRRTGRPADAAGDKGNVAHDSGAHRSQEWLLNSIYCDNRAYTVQPGLTATQARHIAGFDFTPSGVDQMIVQSRRLIAAMRGGQLDEVLAVYCNVDGDQVVDGWDNVRDRAATSDTSHLWHWHLTLDRRHMTNRALMERIVAIAMGEMTMTDLDYGAWKKPARVEGRPAALLLAEQWTAEMYGESAYGGKTFRQLQLDRIEAAVNELAERETPAPVPADIAAFKAALLDPEVLAAFAKAVTDEQAARLAN